MAVRFAYIYLAKGADPAVHRMRQPSPDGVEVEVVAVPDYSSAMSVAKDLVAAGCVMLELCAGFGNIGLGMVTEAVNGEVPVGAIRFDGLPVIDNKSGDTVFGS